MERCVFLEEVPEGSVVMRHVVSKDGSVLVDPGTVLTAAHIARLKQWEVITLYIQSDEGAATTEEFGIEMGALPPEEVVEWETLAAEAGLLLPTEEEKGRIEEEIERRAAAPPRAARLAPPPETFVYRPDDLRRARAEVERAHLETSRRLSGVVRSVVRRDGVNVGEVTRIAERLVELALRNRHMLAGVAMIRTYADPVLSHAVKSSLFSLLLGHALGMNRDELLDLAECALLHDVGMSGVSPRTWRKAGPLTRPERLEVERHVLLGADLLQRSEGFSPRASVVAYQHHERWDGSGYPKERRGATPHENSRIVGLADAWSAMTSPRSWRPARSGYDAMREIVAGAGARFEPALVQLLLQALSLFPIGSGVRLSDGRRGVVVGSVAHAPYRPVVRITGEEAPLDLSREPHLGIAAAEVATQEELDAAFTF